MKRFLSMLMIATCILMLFGCTGEVADEATAPIKTEEASTFRIGYGRTDITPLTSVPLAGYGNATQRISQNVLDPQMATCIAITDENENTVLMMSYDQQRASDITVEAVRPMISQATGVPQDHIMLAGTHTHSGPDLTVSSNEAIARYIPYLNEQLVKAAVAAMEDRTPVTDMQAGSIETEAMNFVRHYSYIDPEDGQEKYFGDSFGTQTLNETTKHITEADPTMYVLKIARQDAKDIVLVNWRAHPSSTGYSNGPLKNISADFVGTFRDAMENRLGCNFIYFNGACGNINSGSRIPGEAKVSSNNERGSVLADYAIACLESNMEAISVGDVQITQRIMDMEINHDMDSMVTQAKLVQAVWQQTNNNAQAIEAGKPYGIRSPYHASAILANANREESVDVEINAISIGEHLSFITFPGELFDDLTEYIEVESPFDYTLTMCYANGMRGYIPTAYAFEYTSYETDCCWFKEGCGEVFRDNLLELLEQLAAEG